MPSTTFNHADIHRKQARDRAKRNSDEIKDHFKKHKFRGLKHKVVRAPLLMQINSETPPVVIAMWTYLCVLSLTIGWFACSLFGYQLCRMWRNVPAPGEGANLEFIFTAQPLNRWAVNLVVSFGMLLFFTSQALLFMWRRALYNRERQKKYAEGNTWIDLERRTKKNSKYRNPEASAEHDEAELPSSSAAAVHSEAISNPASMGDTSNPSTHTVSDSRAGRSPATLPSSPAEHGMSSAPSSSAPAVEEDERMRKQRRELERRRKKEAASAMPGSDENARAAGHASSKPSSTTMQER